MFERRQHDRCRSFAVCTAAGRPRGAALHGVVRDLSEGGVRLLLDAPRRAPAEMDLALGGRTRPARIVWRSEVAVGLAFLPAASVASLDAARRARLGDGARLAERIARFVGPSRRPGPA